MKRNPKEIAIAFHEKGINQKEDKSKFFDQVWHFHDSFEIVYIKKGKGLLFLGEEAVVFKEGDLFLFGTLLPHKWLSDKAYFDTESKLSIHSQVIHFRKELLLPSFLSMEEHHELNYLVQASKKGLRVNKNSKEKIIALIGKMSKMDGFEKTITLYTILNLLSNVNNIEMLSKESFQDLNNPKQLKRLNIVNKYVFDNFKENISLDKISDHVSMSKSAFCKYFKLYTNRPFNVYLNEFRIHHAKKLIRSKDLTITEACYDSGFNNIANFNRRFKSHTGLTPSQYRKICLERE